jgi:predicted 3-demethylubiquinone-9 3-methyltransferase (glyoxalase superfamily)
MQKITPFLWFDDKAEEAARFYASTFKNSKIGTIARYDEAGANAAGRPKGSVMTVSFQLEGQDFTGLNGGPVFKFTPAISLLVVCKTQDEVNALWRRLSEGGSVLMPLDAYPFSERYGWTQDRYGLSWQITHAANRQIGQQIIPTLMFVGAVCGKAEEAINFYVSVFKNAKVGHLLRHGKGEEPDKEGTVSHAAFTLESQEFAAMDSAQANPFTFNEALSSLVNCETQDEIDYYWSRLSAVPAAEQCGWLNDKYGVSWQIVPTILGEMLSDKDPAKSQRVMKAMLQMSKINIKALQQAYDQQ